jgi:hypothetical protein
MTCWPLARSRTDLFNKSHRHQLTVPPVSPTPEGISTIGSGEQLQQVQLSTYRAAITTNIRLDDGLETKRSSKLMRR